MVTNLAPNHTMSWGCGHLDVDKPTGGWQCNVTKQYYTASGSDGCEYIYLHSLIVPTAGNPLVTHTIDVRVVDDQGEVSNFGGITLKIHYNSTPDATEPVNPCNSF